MPPIHVPLCQNENSDSDQTCPKMNFLLISQKNKEKERARRAHGRRLRRDDDDDVSETWSLPAWPELQIYRTARAERKKRRARRLQREKAKAEEAKKLGKSSEANKAGQDQQPQTDPCSVPIESDTEKEEDILDEAQERGRWSNSWEFLMSIISMSVGMGNFYRFPFVAYQNGGGAFLIPYLLILTFVGRPMYLLELALGQFCSFGQVKCWEMSPFFRGVGYGSAIGSFVVVTYYSSVMATTMFYLIHSFHTTLPWTECDPEWATQKVCDQIEAVYKNGSAENGSMPVNLAQLYFDRVVVKEKQSIDDGIGLPEWKQTLCLLASWLMIFFVIARGVESSGKVAYFTTIYPFTIIIVLLITSCTKGGAFEGMLYFLTPDWGRILDPNVWFAAAGQSFFSLSAGFGPIINYASYNPFHHPIYKDAIIVSVMDTLASFLAGLTVFATLGTLSQTLRKPISEVVSDGPGLVFVSFSDAIANFAYVPQLLSVLFYLMLLTLAIGSAVAWQMAAISVILDRFPKLSKFWITFTMCLAGFAIALIYVTPGGQFMVTLVDNFGGNVNIYILSTLECVGVAWVYGLNNFSKDYEFMLGKKLGWFWKTCWGFVVPILLTIVLVYAFATSKRLEYNGKPFPDSAIVCGWMLTSISLLCVPVGAFYAMYKSSGNFKERFFKSLKPTAEFGPRNPYDREQWELFRAGKLDVADIFKAPSLHSDDSTAHDEDPSEDYGHEGSLTSPLRLREYTDYSSIFPPPESEDPSIVPPRKVVSAFARVPSHP